MKWMITLVALTMDAECTDSPHSGGTCLQFTDQVVWDVVDFAIFGALLASVGIAYELAARKSGNTAYRFAFGVALVAAFILVGVNGAVGVIGTEMDDANLMFGGVLVVGIIGAFIARFQPRGMARALFATALTQVLVAALWLLSAWLFRKAAQEQPSNSCNSSDR